MDEWKKQLEEIFSPNANIPVNLNKLYSTENVLGFNDEALVQLKNRIRLANVKYNFDQVISDIDDELDRRSKLRESLPTIYWTGIGAVAAVLGVVISF